MTPIKSGLTSSSCICRIPNIHVYSKLLFKHYVIKETATMTPLILLTLLTILSVNCGLLNDVLKSDNAEKKDSGETKALLTNVVNSLDKGVDKVVGVLTGGLVPKDKAKKPVDDKNTKAKTDVPTPDTSKPKDDITNNIPDKSENNEDDAIFSTTEDQPAIDEKASTISQ